MQCASMTIISCLARMMRILLEKRRFLCNSDGNEADEGLHQRCVLTRLIFNMYTIDQPILTHQLNLPRRRFGYSDYAVISTQSIDLPPIEETLTSALVGLSEYYTTSQSRANPAKVQVNLVHYIYLRHHEFDNQFNINWNGVNEPCVLNHSVYRGVILKRIVVV